MCLYVIYTWCIHDSACPYPNLPLLCHVVSLLIVQHAIAVVCCRISCKTAFGWRVILGKFVLRKLKIKLYVFMSPLQRPHMSATTITTTKSKLRITGLCGRKPPLPVIGGFLSQRHSNAESASMSLRHHGQPDASRFIVHSGTDACNRWACPHPLSNRSNC